MIKINNETAAKKIEAIADGKIFRVDFIKRSDGTERRIVCRKGVKEFVSGEGAAYDPKEKNLVCVWDCTKYAELKAEWQQEHPKEEFTKEIRQVLGAKAYRSINLEMIIRLKVEGVEYVVNEFPPRNFRLSWKQGKTCFMRTVVARTEGEAVIVFKRETGMLKRPPNTEIVDCGLSDGSFEGIHDDEPTGDFSKILD